MSEKPSLHVEFTGQVAGIKLRLSQVIPYSVLSDETAWKHMMELIRVKLLDSVDNPPVLPGFQNIGK